MPDRNQLTEEMTAAREQAEALLRSLQAARATPAEGGDLFAKVTGRSSIDTAIANTRRMLEAYDRVLVQLRAGVTPAMVEIAAARRTAGAFV